MPDEDIDYIAKCVGSLNFHARFPHVEAGNTQQGNFNANGV